MPHILFANLPYLLQAAGVTLLLSVVCTVLAALIGIVAALAQSFGGWPTRGVALLYLYLMRGTPLIVMLFAAFYLLPYAGIDVDATTGGVMMVSLYFGAFMGEVFRGALASVPRGQWDAGRALGMHGTWLMRIVVVPQALRLAGPPFVNTCIMLVKSTSLVSVIGLWELTLAGREVVERTLAPFQVFGGIAAIYFVMCYGLALCGRMLERRVPHAQ
ncbi:MAG TPA: amino acid ABC transporter permease [Acetobacteraceae bacterium]|jgi:His/Glu/Gln/Arg/opine family amino acid ABC transporter permease subunit|nr:amino acid ABC transporter permease [Acetobacteraceae bacterium]